MNQKSLYTCGITGQRKIENLSKKNKEKLKKTVNHYLNMFISSLDVKRFYNGLAIGSDLLIAQSILELRQYNKDIKLNCILPCENQCKYWKNQNLIEKYEKILKEADFIRVLSKKYNKTCMMDRNKYIVNHSDFLFAIYDRYSKGGTKNTIDYAISKGKQIFILDPNNLKMYSRVGDNI